MTCASKASLGHAVARLLSLLLLCSAACSDFEIKNKQPVARARVLVGGLPVPGGEMPIPFAGTPVAVTLDGSGSGDVDGSIARYLWLASDVSPTERFAGNGLIDAGGLPPFTGDPPQGTPTPQVQLGEGTYQYSLWVVDDEGYTSEPATVEFTIETPTNYMPDAACLTGYTADAMECEECVCSPNAMMGCFEQYTACFTNPDPMFVMLCSAVVACAQSVGCAGSACYTGGCMPQIDAAATYMGGTLALCSMPAAAATNPCAAASMLGACSSGMGACATPCL